MAWWAILEAWRGEVYGEGEGAEVGAPGVAGPHGGGLFGIAGSPGEFGTPQGDGKSGFGVFRGRHVCVPQQVVPGVSPQGEVARSAVLGGPRRLGDGVGVLLQGSGPHSLMPRDGGFRTSRDEISGRGISRGGRPSRTDVESGVCGAGRVGRVVDFRDDVVRGRQARVLWGPGRRPEVARIGASARSGHSLLEGVFRTPYRRVKSRYRRGSGRFRHPWTV